MRVKNGLKKIIFVVLLCICGLSFPQWNAEAANVTFGQSILPVRFVYLDQEGEVSSIWSNVSAKDKVYVVKFFNEKTRSEVGIDKGLLVRYRTAMTQDENQAVKLKGFARNNNMFTQASIDFVEKGDYLEEVHTIV